MEIDNDFVKFLEEEGYKHVTYIPNKGYCGLYGFIFTVGLVTGLTRHDYRERFCYPHKDSIHAILALTKWGLNSPEKDDVPDDEYWIKSKGTVEIYNKKHKSYNEKFDKN